MKRALPLLCLPLLLAACSTPPSGGLTLESRMRNPLFANRYWEELVDRMASLQIKKDPTASGAVTGPIVNATRLSALQNAQAITERLHGGLLGNFLSMKEPTEGQMFVTKDMLYLGTDFLTYPGPSLHLYVTAAVDPRDKPFPGATATDLGLLQSPYGAQEYPIPDGKGAVARTVVLWDTQLQRLYAFSQLSR